MLKALLVATLALAGVPSDDVLVAPQIVEVVPAQPYADVTLTNRGDAQREILTDALAWSQDDEGRVTLAETEAVSMYPQRADLAPGEQRRFRLTVVERAPVRPAAYRIGLSIRDPATGEKVIALIPAFVLPEHPVESAAVDVVCPGAERCDVKLLNTGNVPMRPARIVLTIATADGGNDEQELDAWWVLPGGTRKYPVTVEPADGPRKVRVRVVLDGVELTSSAEITR